MTNLPMTEELDFAYLLELMPPLHGISEYSWLPELFSIIGHEKLLLLSKYAGGETITIPTLDELVLSIESLQWFYDVYLKHLKTEDDIPYKYRRLVRKIVEVYDARNGEINNQ